MDIRSCYEGEPGWLKGAEYLNGGPAPEFEYHRFGAWVDVATAYSTYAELFGNEQ